ncbi:MAG: hypothetical protein GEU93_02440 [Propionibacteriales bacterium]|nr:hypothetical protein [Propionibacteriales bacterium]
MNIGKGLKNRVFGRERVVELDLEAREIVGHLLVTRTSLWGWYGLAPQEWTFTSEDTRTRLWDQNVHRYAQLAGHAIRVRTSSRPFPAYDFARKLDQDTPNPLPDVPGVETFDTYLEAQQRRLHTSLLDDKIVTLGVRLGDAPPVKILRSMVRGEAPSTGAGAKLLEEIKQLNQHLAGTGFDARPLSPTQMAWLMHRSCSLGMPVPPHAGVAGGEWTGEDLYAFTDPVDWFYKPMGRTVRLVGLTPGEKPVERHVAVLTLGRMPTREFPQDGIDPWMLATDRLAVPVEWSASGYLVPPTALRSAVEFERNRAENIDKHYREHEETPPPAVTRGIKEAIATYDEVTEGDARTAVRFAGPIRAAVWGTTEDECLSHARTLMDRYGESYRIEVAHPPGQVELLREFIPGELWALSGYQRRMSVGYFAAGMPHVSSSVGTPTGPYLGYTTATARRAVLHDGHFPMERLNAPGVVPIVAEPGGGKSTLVGVLAYHSVTRGQPTIILDPSGPLARLCQMPSFAPHARHLNLTDAEPGTLAPWQLIPEPQPQEFRSEREYGRAKARAHAERKQLGFDTFRMMLPNTTLRNPATDKRLRDAIRYVGGSVSVNPHQVIKMLRAGDEYAREIADLLEESSEFPLGELIFPTDRSSEFTAEAATDKQLVVITMPGLVLPSPDTDRDHWSIEELFAQPLLHLAAFYTSRFIYRRSMGERKNIFLDESHFMGNWGSGRALFVRLGRDSRKWNTAVYTSSQHPEDVLSVGRVEALIGGALVGRLEDLDIAEKAMTGLLRAPKEYATAVTKLSPRPAPGSTFDVSRTGEFIYRDCYGRVDKIRVDRDWAPELATVLETTPGLPRLASKEAPPQLFIDEVADLFGLGRDGAAA